MESLSEKLKAYRKEKGLTQPGLAKELDVAKSVISDIESGRRTASKKTYAKLAKHSGYNIGWWMGEYVEDNEASEDLSATKFIIDKLIEEGLLISGEIDDDIARMLLNTLKADIELKLKRK